jgi:succinate dehydrogenase flavin-adding protein (antitoxin of CptAB toxin-antitoxin module)
LEVLLELEDEELKDLTTQKKIPQYNNFKDLYKKIGLKRKDTR